MGYISRNTSPIIGSDDGRSISQNVAHLNIIVHDMINLLYYEYWTDKQKYLYVYLAANIFKLNQYYSFCKNLLFDISWVNSCFWCSLLYLLSTLVHMKNPFYYKNKAVLKIMQKSKAWAKILFKIIFFFEFRLVYIILKHCCHKNHFTYSFI